MLKKKFKIFLKASPLVFNVTTWVIYFYLKFSYFTTRWYVIYPKSLNKQTFLSQKKVIFALWHNKLAFSFKIFEHHQNLAALASKHSDGKVITKITRLWGFDVIEGSTNKNPTGAIKEIISKLSTEGKIVITPDGPRGPKYKINSRMTKIASKHSAKVIPVTCAASTYFTLNSWDQMIIPKPFSKVVIVIGESIFLSEDDKQNSLELENKLNQLTIQAEGVLDKL